jgi:hypothetical protein
MRILLNLSLGVTLALVSACSGTSSLGTSNESTTGNEPDGGAPESSAGSGSGGTAAGSSGSSGDGAAGTGNVGGAAGTGNVGGSGGSVPGSCTTAEECPGSLPCLECADRSQVCPAFQCINGRCELPEYACPEVIACTTRSDCPVTRGLCVECPDGKASCQDYACEQNVCVLVYPPCAPVSNPCEGKRCGESCFDCRPTLPGAPPCFVGKCDYGGECLPGPIACE